MGPFSPLKFSLRPLSIHCHSHKFQIRRNGEEEVMETDELNFQEVKTKSVKCFLTSKRSAQASTDNHGGASVTSDLSFSAGPPGTLEVQLAL